MGSKQNLATDDARPHVGVGGGAGPQARNLNRRQSGS